MRGESYVAGSPISTRLPEEPSPRALVLPPRAGLLGRSRHRDRRVVEALHLARSDEGRALRTKGGATSSPTSWIARLPDPGGRRYHGFPLARPCTTSISSARPSAHRSASRSRTCAARATTTRRVLGTLATSRRPNWGVIVARTKRPRLRVGSPQHEEGRTPAEIARSPLAFVFATLVALVAARLLPRPLVELIVKVRSIAGGLACSSGRGARRRELAQLS